MAHNIARVIGSWFAGCGAGYRASWALVRGPLAFTHDARFLIYRSGPFHIGSLIHVNQRLSAWLGSRAPLGLSGARAMFLSNIYVKF